MALDDVLFGSFARGAARPVVRVYGWSAPALTIGASQNAGRVLDLDRCLRDGLAVVRRPTGGRAVFHGGDLAYCVISDCETPPFGGRLEESWRSIGDVLCAALRSIGVDASVQDAHSVAGEGAAVPCFASGRRSEVSVGGKKIIGSARKRGRGAFIQQGSILVGPDYSRVADYALSTGRTEVMGWRIHECAVSLAELKCGDPDPADVTRALYEAFSSVLDGRIERVEPTPAEMAGAERLTHRYMVCEPTRATGG